jgi:enterochelin esterase-like enzyme
VLSSLTTFAFGQSECKSTATGELHIEHFEGTILPGPHTLRVWLPPGYSDSANAQRRYPVLYMLDGQNMFDGCPGMNHEEWQIDESLTRLIDMHTEAARQARFPPDIAFLFPAKK